MKLLKKITAILMIFGAFTIGGFACGGGGDEGNEKSVGQTMEDTGDKAGNAAEKAGDKAGNAMEETGDAAKDATH